MPLIKYLVVRIFFPRNEYLTSTTRTMVTRLKNIEYLSILAESENLPMYC